MIPIIAMKKTLFLLSILISFQAHAQSTLVVDQVEFLFPDHLDETFLRFKGELVAQLSCRKTPPPRNSSLVYHFVTHDIPNPTCETWVKKAERGEITPNTPLRIILGNRSNLISWKHCKPSNPCN